MAGSDVVVQHWEEWSKACLQDGYFRLERMGVNGESCKKKELTMLRRKAELNMVVYYQGCNDTIHRNLITLGLVFAANDVPDLQPRHLLHPSHAPVHAPPRPLPALSRTLLHPLPRHPRMRIRNRMFLSHLWQIPLLNRSKVARQIPSRLR